MSAYALPSSLLSSLSSLSPITTTPSSSSSSSSLSSSGTSEITANSSNKSTSSCGPTLECRDSGKTSENSEVALSFSYAKEGESNNNDTFTSSSSSSSSTTSSWYSTKNDLFISIKSASIDHIRLIQSFTMRKSSSTNIASKSDTNDDVNESSSTKSSSYNVDNEMSNSSSASTNNSYRNSDCSCDNEEQWGEYGDEDIDTATSANSHSLLFGGRETEQRRDPTHTTSSSSLPLSSSPQSPPPPKKQHPQINSSSHNNDNPENNNHVENDAIQFTLAISFNGRKYNATRTLPSFIKLRNDLMMELSNKCNNNHKRGVHKNKTYQCSKSSSSQSSPSSNVNRQHQGADVIRSNNDLSDNINVKEHHIIIPELPIGNSTSNNDKCEFGKSQKGTAGAYSSSTMMGIAARSGFSGLQAAVLSYCPQMESWLRSVAALAPSSASLANFLWEPIHNQCQQEENGQRKEQRQQQQQNQCISNMNNNHHQGSRTSQWYKHLKRKSSSASLMKLDSITEDSSDESDAES